MPLPHDAADELEDVVVVEELLVYGIVEYEDVAEDGVGGTVE